MEVIIQKVKAMNLSPEAIKFLLGLAILVGFVLMAILSRAEGTLSEGATTT